MLRRSILYILPLILLSSCIDWDGDPVSPNNVEGYQPIYMAAADAYNVYATTPQDLKNPGKIYIFNDYLFINEINRGIHVIDNSDPSNPVKLSFINIPGNKDIAVSSNILYADNITDLVALDISDVQNITVEKRIKDAYDKSNQFYPTGVFNVYFECVDTAKGVVVDWKLTTLKDPKCYR